MAKYNRDSILSDLLLIHPDLISVISRFGVFLGVEDSTIEEICRQHKIDLKFFLSIINTYIDEGYFPSDAKESFPIEGTVDYLRKTSEYYLQIQLPNIERHFHSLMARSGDENNLPMLMKFFYEMQAQFKEWVEFEQTEFFPLLIKGEGDDKMVETSTAYSLEIEEKLQDLLTFFVRHLKGSYERNLCNAVVSAVFALKKDINQNNRIRLRFFSFVQ